MAKNDTTQSTRNPSTSGDNKGTAAPATTTTQPSEAPGAPQPGDEIDCPDCTGEDWKQPGKRIVKNIVHERQDYGTCPTCNGSARVKYDDHMQLVPSGEPLTQPDQQQAANPSEPVKGPANQTANPTAAQKEAKDGETKPTY